MCLGSIIQVFGPYVHPVATKESLGTTLGVYYSALTGAEKPQSMTEALQGDWVDVRDVAAHHVLAVTTPAAGGKRLISSNGTWAYQELCEYGCWDRADFTGG